LKLGLRKGGLQLGHFAAGLGVLGLLEWRSKRKRKIEFQKDRRNRRASNEMHQPEEKWNE
jgi:hypothetical protein